ncbi:MAG: carbohydrate-binding protein [Clostridia bacterium]|nr:carbohydrate-binding protein [Clostridia bacterium]
MYYESGVIITPNVVAEGDNATVTYKGLLKKSGADSVYMHVGYGEDWRSSRSIQMTRTHDGFEAKLPVTEYDKLNIAFKDSADNWDNNSGRNYRFEVQSR